MIFIQTATELQGEQRTKINAGLNAGLEKLRSTGFKVQNVNVNGAIRVEAGDPQTIIDYLSKHPAIKKFVTFEIN